MQASTERLRFNKHMKRSPFIIVILICFSHLPKNGIKTGIGDLRTTADKCKPYVKAVSYVLFRRLSFDILLNFQVFLSLQNP